MGLQRGLKQMQYRIRYESPLGGMALAADDAGLTGLWFEGQKYFPQGLDRACERRDLPVFEAAARWLDAYFAGRAPEETPPLHLTGTAFQTEVWALLRAVPYGQTVTYGQLAARLAQARGVAHMSAQAVGGAVGHNPISIIIPCHRVLGADGGLTGYAGGVERKAALLRLEGALRA